ncbi:terpene synthase-like [Zophobas morio]|uniref:terpene synthase-like n=1 Tax=Zophobas morio TaxID=2755281 RepID=UPI00308331C0
MQNLLCYAENRKDIALDDFIELGIRMFTGQGLEIYFRDIQRCPTFHEYNSLIRGSIQYSTFLPIVECTAVIKWGVQLLKFCAKKEKMEFSENLYNKLGLVLQVYGDYINLHNAKIRKLFIAFKFCLIIFHFNMLKRRPLDMESKKLFVDILESFGSFEYTRKELEKLKNGILTDADNMNMGKNPYLKRVLEDLLGNLETEIYFDDCD